MDEVYATHAKGVNPKWEENQYKMTDTDTQTRNRLKLAMGKEVTMSKQRKKREMDAVSIYNSIEKENGVISGYDISFGK